MLTHYALRLLGPYNGAHADFKAGTVENPAFALNTRIQGLPLEIQPVYFDKTRWEIVAPVCNGKPLTDSTIETSNLKYANMNPPENCYYVAFGGE